MLAARKFVVRTGMTLSRIPDGIQTPAYVVDVAKLKARPYRNLEGKGLRQYWEEFPRKGYVAGVS